MLLPLRYQYCGQYDHMVDIEIDSDGYLKKHIGNYTTQAPIRKKLIPQQLTVIEQALSNINHIDRPNTRSSEREFSAQLNYGNDANSKTVRWHGPAIEQDEDLNRFIELILSL